VAVAFPYFGGIAHEHFASNKQQDVLMRAVPAKKVGDHLVASVYDLLMAQYGVARGLPGQYPASYDDASAPYTPAWAEQYTGMGRDMLVRFAREWARTAELTGGNYFRATDTASLAAIYEKIDELEKSRVEEKQYVDYREWAIEPVQVAGMKMPPLVVLALLALVAQVVLSHTLFRRLV